MKRSFQDGLDVGVGEVDEMNAVIRICLMKSNDRWIIKFASWGIRRLGRFEFKVCLVYALNYVFLISFLVIFIV